MCTFHSNISRREEIDIFVEDFLLANSDDEDVIKGFNTVVDYLSRASLTDAEIDPLKLFDDFVTRKTALDKAINRAWHSRRLTRYFISVPAAIPFLYSILAHFQTRRRKVAEKPEEIFVKEWLLEHLDLELVRTQKAYLGYSYFLGAMTQMVQVFSHCDWGRRIPRLSRELRKNEMCGYNNEQLNSVAALIELVLKSKVSVSHNFLKAFLAQRTKGQFGKSQVVQAVEFLEDNILKEWQRPTMKSRRVQRMHYFLEAYAEA